jgi:predicted nucleic acid-binding protein
MYSSVQASDQVAHRSRRSSRQCDLAVIVLDTSAAIAVFCARVPVAGLRSRLEAEADIRAPHLIDIEFLHALRRLVIAGEITEGRADEARVDFAAAAIIRHPHEVLAERIWELRFNLSAYDAAFVALAEALDVPLITCDGPLARAPGNEARVELFAEA